MNKHLSIQYILQELYNNPDNRDRFNKSYQKKIIKLDKTNLVFALDTVKFNSFEFVGDFQQIAIIRTALSRVNGKAVLGALERVEDHYFRFWEKQQLEELEKSDATFGRNSETSKRILAELSYERYKYACTLDYLLYQAFDTPLRNGEGLEKALTALDQYFIEEGEIIKLNVK